LRNACRAASRLDPAGASPPPPNPNPAAAQYDGGLLPCTLLRRYKRFLADVTFAEGGVAQPQQQQQQRAAAGEGGGAGAVTTVHCPNTGE
jgi:hypothetical protein